MKQQIPMTWHALLHHGSILLKGDLPEKIFVGAKVELLKRKVTSLEKILAHPVTTEEVQEAIIAGFEQELDVICVRVDNRVALPDG